MRLKEYFKNVNDKLNDYDKKAKNPFLDYDYSYNPFKGAFKQTYIWIEKENKKEERV